MIGGSWPPMRVKCSQRWSRAASRRSSATGPPVVELLPHLEIEERLRRYDTVEGAHPVRQVEELAPRRGDDLDDDVELARDDDDVVRLVPARYLVRDALGRPRCLDADERLVEAEPERIGDADDLEDARARQPCVPRADRRFRDAEAD